MNWLARNAGAIEAVAATVTALVAVVAIVGIKFQLDAADRLARTQSARDAYRGHLSLASTLPQFAAPTDVCILLESTESGAYTAFVDHLLYSAEQMMDVETGWEATFIEALTPHAPYLCAAALSGPQAANLEMPLSQFRAVSCQDVATC